MMRKNNYWLAVLFALPVLAAVAGCDGGPAIGVALVTDQTEETPDGTDETGEVTSQQGLIAKYSGATFVSAEQLEVGETANGSLAMGHWSVSFTADTVTWTYSDVVEVGTYSYVDSSTSVANFSGREVTFNGDGISLTWDTREYLRTASSVFDSQQSLVNYLDGTTYNSVEELDLGENSSGGLATGNWSVSFNDNEVILAVQDTLQVGTYSFIDDSSFRINFLTGGIAVYVLSNNQLLVNSVVYEKDYSELFDSQESLVAFLDGATYKSAELQQLGEAVDGIVAVGHWMIDFNADTFSWFYQDIAEAGTVVYLAENRFTAVLANREITVEMQRGDILWDGVRYVKE